MSDTMPIEEYIAQGGVLSSPDNVTPRYRGELLRLMASFVDSELAGSAGFADVINDAPGIQERISAARIVLEKTDHAGQVLKVMETFGANVARYAVHHPWSKRMERDAEIGALRQGDDMRLSVFHYPLKGWTDAVVMNVLMGLATVIQLDELSRVSYQPLAEAFRAIRLRELRHQELGVQGLNRIVASNEQRDLVKSSLEYWRPRIAASFGHSDSKRFETQSRFGLRHKPNETLLSEWVAATEQQLGSLGLN
ncbi:MULTISPECIES: Phenylacetic acid catabolic protein [Rhizobium/Agrobacterium group]|uniref:Phenylacetic acid catabolic protein n=1 Tax=Rhizobium/Agrobacterium group TaxID=227290 RepID=UPI00107EF088|nr:MULTISPECIES: Phenylacetic acid catabolic protein [Rhizobium/Agrobacterium group]MBB4403135.1 1,2-phenylacetyl-CoA epoxidase catalytic subunit [Agrobacterium radiobacter]MBB5588955.1 1,2-phenylacetyl-CoA epoxidase catalytic subunit [Agrobacterium radiobacter]TGE86602.1 phenylacetic acid catabolic [Rhizobium sp. SEMIA 4032]